ncbi:cell cycle control protein cwf15 [Holotrichia oblita]|uniref:Cell cycle control protein cwf15 n=1 Tax=Holotrichia oblita TaxID=644536 RepID=A0ACB9TH01_HOLOL|nr:cell cycle control protein cwf15 [Holotrichia oblita]
MTTAARPTFEPARGGQGRNEKDLSAISRQYSSRDLPGHTKLKYREHGQGTIEETRNRDFRKELEDRERDVRGSRGSRPSEQSKRLKLDQVPAASLDADDPLEEDSDSSDSDEDDTEALLAELNKIKKERAMEHAKKEIERRQEEERIRMENILAVIHYLHIIQLVQLKQSIKLKEDGMTMLCLKIVPVQNLKRK